MGFSRPQLVVASGLFFHDGILAITKPLSRTFSFFTMEFWLSRSLSRELFLFSRWNSGYHKAFLTNFFLFSRWNSGYDKAFLTNFFLFSRWNSGYHKAFLTNFFLFSWWNSRDTRFEGRLFSYTYHKKYLQGSASLKTLPLDLEPPLQGKEYDPSYSNATRKSKTNFLSRNHL
jgi:hypothetical protein